MNGFGICTNDITQMTIEGIKALIAQMPESAESKTLTEAIADAYNDGINDVDEFAEYLGQGWQNYDEVGIATVLAVVIRVAENIRMRPVMDDQGWSYLVFPERSPWEYTHREKELSETELHDIIHKYVGIITPEEIKIQKIAI